MLEGLPSRGTGNTSGRGARQDIKQIHRAKQGEQEPHNHGGGERLGLGEMGKGGGGRGGMGMEEGSWAGRGGAGGG